MLKRDAGLVCAIRAVGRAKMLAAAVGVTEQAVSQWTRCPAGRVLQVESISGIPRHVLRPDLYPRPPTTEAA